MRRAVQGAVFVPHRFPGPVAAPLVALTMMSWAFLRVARGADAALPRSGDVPAPSLAPKALGGLGPARAMTLPEALAYARIHQPTLRSALARVVAAAAE